MSVLAVSDLYVSYGPVQALRGVSLSVEPSETVAVLGANGAGKSTLLRAVSGLIPSSRGVITFHDRDIRRTPPQDIARLRLAHVPEGRHVFRELTVEENLLVGGYRLRKDRQKLAALLADVYDLFPRLAERKKQLSSSLSGGEQQMLSLGRALMSEPELLMLDEPSLGLAPIIVSRVFDAIQQMQSRGMTILLVEQNASVALRHCSRAVVLSLGQVVATGTGAELLEDPTVQAAYLGAGPKEEEVLDRQETRVAPVPPGRYRTPR